MAVQWLRSVVAFRPARLRARARAWRAVLSRPMLWPRVNATGRAFFRWRMEKEGGQMREPGGGREEWRLRRLEGVPVNRTRVCAPAGLCGRAQCARLTSMRSGARAHTNTRSNGSRDRRECTRERSKAEVYDTLWTGSAPRWRGSEDGCTATREPRRDGCYRVAVLAAVVAACGAAAAGCSKHSAAARPAVAVAVMAATCAVSLVSLGSSLLQSSEVVFAGTSAGRCAQCPPVRLGS